MYKIKTEKFEGPFEALLDLIEERKLSINEVSLAQVCQDYLAYLKTLKELPRLEAAAFLSVGATLMLVKSRTLIPTLELTQEEEESIEELEERLKLLKEFRAVSRQIREQGQKKQILFSREAFAGCEFGFLPPEKTTIGTLHKLVQNLVALLPKQELLPEKTLAKVITIEQKSRDLIDRIQNRLSGSLEKVISAKDKVELIVGFLAILELIKQGFFEFEQKNVFGEVELKRVA